MKISILKSFTKEPAKTICYGMRYNSATLRRRKRRKTLERVMAGLFAILAALAILAVVISGLWLLISFIDISAHAPTMAGQAPEYWQHNLILFLLEL